MQSGAPSLRTVTILLALASSLVATAAPGQPYERWDTKLRNSHGVVLKEEDTPVAGRPAYVNGEWQGAFNFELSNCPGAGCLTLSGTIANSTSSLSDYLGVYRLPAGACVLRAAIGEDKEGMDDGFVLSLAPTDAAKQGCKVYSAKIAGHYEPYWINHAKMATQSKAAMAAH